MKIEPAIISIVGWHAKESVEDIIQRKRDDINKAGRTIWLFHSQKAPIQTVQEFGRAHFNAAVLFLRGSAFPTGTADQARQMSDDQSHWSHVPDGIGPVTGRLPAGGLVMGELTPIHGEIDLWQYLEHPAKVPIKFRQGASTACAIPAPGGAVDGMKSRHRQIVAIGRLIPPFGVFLR